MKKITDNEIIEIADKYNSFGEKLFDANENYPITDSERITMIERLEYKFSEILDILRISRDDPNCANTPHRLAKMYVNEIFSGRFVQPPEMTFFPNRKQVDNLVISKGIQVMSICSHHWQPIAGRCTVGYIPAKRVIGLSKISRIVEWFSRRGQIQEELGEQIADFLQELLAPKALGVVINARHYCMIARGVRGSEEDTIMTTSVMRGYLLKDLRLRNEFINLIDK
ncbi:MAG: GTP cyclohydrolase I [Ignavibacteria bacterium]|jgi:GTP cyclohydrolase I|nr:GTP cyclohydrolase I [Ignavibacteria bacterium]